MVLHEAAASVQQENGGALTHNVFGVLALPRTSAFCIWAHVITTKKKDGESVRCVKKKSSNVRVGKEASGAESIIFSLDSSRAQLPRAAKSLHILRVRLCNKAYTRCKQGMQWSFKKELPRVCIGRLLFWHRAKTFASQFSTRVTSRSCRGLAHLACPFVQ